MSLIFSAITPHSPLLIPNIGKKNLEFLKKTKDSYDKLKEAIADNEIETLIVISSHAGFGDEVFNINLSPEFKINFEDFSDFSTTKELKGDIILANQIRKESEKKEDYVRIMDKPILNHGIGIPAYLLSEQIKNLKIVPLYCSEASLTQHQEWGAKIKEAILKSKKKIVVIISADLSHKLNKNSPAGYSSKAAGLDQKIIKFIQSQKITDLNSLDPEIFNETATEGIKSIAVLGGIIGKMDYKAKLLSYEHPFGAGYAVMKIDF